MGSRFHSSLSILILANFGSISEIALLLNSLAPLGRFYSINTRFIRFGWRGMLLTFLILQTSLYMSVFLELDSLSCAFTANFMQLEFLICHCSFNEHCHSANSIPRLCAQSSEFATHRLRYSTCMSQVDLTLFWGNSKCFSDPKGNTGSPPFESLFQRTAWQPTQHSPLPVHPLIISLIIWFFPFCFLISPQKLSFQGFCTCMIIVSQIWVLLAYILPASWIPSPELYFLVVLTCISKGHSCVIAACDLPIA